ncbi:FecR family protein [Carboxylicivirga taeanensis]|uniref:FecR family protein n=1 Tax=Carboxylicivirga taeanensis TaxID=1416875 RepID=UPI003F6DC820
MDKKTYIAQQINNITGNRRLTKQQLEQAETFMDSFAKSDIDNYLKQQWQVASSTPSETNLTFEQIKQKTNPANPIKNWIIGTAAAAIIAGILYTGWILTTIGQPTHFEHIADYVSKQSSSPPPTVMLETPNSIYELNSNSIEIQTNGIALSGQSHKLALNRPHTEQKDNTLRKQSWSKLIIPRGKDFHLQLSDGTEVWINAGSTLSFPDFFDAQQRVVKLDGEAYFKVKSDEQHPFFVETPHETVCVTGTQFNICTYSDEPMSRITLAEGKVSVTIDKEEHHLLPGEQLQQTFLSGIIRKEQVDVSLYTSWKDGVFEFNDMTLREISFRLSKWYDVKFHFDNEQIGELRFSGMTKHNYDLEYFLKIIAKTTNVKFEKNNSGIKVSEL